MAALLLVALGSALGGIARFLVSGAVSRALGDAFPWGTLVVNASGALAIGILWALMQAGMLGSPGAWQFGASGFLGSYTTVSAFSLHTLTLARDGHWRPAAGNVGGSLVLCLGAAAGGAALTRALLA